MKKFLNFFLIFFSIVLLVALSRFNYLIFHTIVELLSISLGISLLFFTFTKIKINELTKFEILALSYAFVAIIDLMHTLTYKGIGVFNSITANEPTQFWISARFLESVSILFFTLFFHKKDIEKNIKKLFYFVFFILLVYLIFSILSILVFDFFPICFIEGYGLTKFKKISEYIIIFILLISLILSKNNDDGSFHYYRYAIILTIFSEFCFTLYKDVFGLYNMTGHIFKYLSFILIYGYVMVNIIEIPYSRIKTLNTQLQKEKQELILAKSEAEKANKAKSAFISNINHEINTPLNAISGFSFILFNELDDSEKKELCQNIFDASQNLYKIFENLITVSEIEIGEYKIEWNNENLKNFIETFVDVYMGDANAKGLYSKYELQDNLDKIIPVPTNVIGIIIANLLGNAIKFTDKGFVSFSARLEENFLYMNFKDSGNGIDIASYSDLINPFNIGEYYLNKTHDGIGLGLSLVNKLVKLMNGKIDFNSKIGEGSEFSIIIDIDKGKYENQN